MKKQDLIKIIKEEIQLILSEDSKTGVISGTQEKELNKRLRDIHNAYVSYDFMHRGPAGGPRSKTFMSDINLGGCGMFAKLLYYNLKKYLNLDPKIIFIAGSWDELPDKNTLETKLNTLKSLNKLNTEEDIICVHIVLKLGDYYLDSSGLHKESWFRNIYKRINLGYGEISIQTLTSMVASGDDWNDTFNRYSTGYINKDMIEVVKAVAALKKDDTNINNNQKEG